MSLTETRFAAFDGSHESVEQRPLTLEEFHVGLGHGKPTYAVDFRILADVARPLRPLQLERVADGALEVQIAANGERRDDLAARLLQRREVDARPVRRRLAEFLLEFALRVVQGSSPSTYSPFGIDHAPSSLRAQNGPPGWPISTSTPPSVTRYSSRPALSFGIRRAWVR